MVFVSSNPILALIVRMNTKRKTIRRHEEEISIARDPPYSDKAPPLKEDTNMEQSSVNPPPMMDGVIRSILIQLSQAATVQAQDMMSQSNGELVPRPHQ